MHHKTKDAAVKKYSTSPLTSADALGALIKEENPEFTFGNVIEILDGIKALKEVPKAPVTAMGAYDLWRGELIVIKDRVDVMGNRKAIHMQFQYVDPKPKRTGQTMPLTGLMSAGYSNRSRFTARKQYTEMWVSAGTKPDIRFIYNDETEDWDIAYHELETA